MAGEVIKRTIDFHGVTICIEWNAGDIKPKYDPDGDGDDDGYELLADYGYFPSTVSGEEGDDLDVFVGPDADSYKVYVACLTDGVGGPMEDKVLLGFPDEMLATDLIKAQYGEDTVSLVYEMAWTDLKNYVTTNDVGQKDAARRFHAKAEEMNQLYGRRDDINDAQAAMGNNSDEAGLHNPMATEIRDPGLPIIGETPGLGVVGNEPALILLLDAEASDDD